MKLHYSQTNAAMNACNGRVLLPYEITLFSNKSATLNLIESVLLPYEITLFSNFNSTSWLLYQVLLPYEITLFSNI